MSTDEIEYDSELNEIRQASMIVHRPNRSDVQVAHFDEGGSCRAYYALPLGVHGIDVMLSSDEWFTTAHLTLDDAMRLRDELTRAIGEFTKHHLTMERLPTSDA